LGRQCIAPDGEAGAGKTTVWQSAIDQVRHRGLTVSSCRPSEAETKLAFAALGVLMEGVSDAVLDCLPAPQRNAIAAALLREETERSPADPRAIGVAASSPLLRISQIHTPSVERGRPPWTVDKCSVQPPSPALAKYVEGHLLAGTERPAGTGW